MEGDKATKLNVHIVVYSIVEDLLCTFFQCKIM